MTWVMPSGIGRIRRLSLRGVSGRWWLRPKKTTLPKPQIWDRSAKVVRSDVRYGDIAILARSLKNIRVPLQIALTSLRVPFRILGGVSFFTRQEVIDVTNLWAAACDPNDSFAVAGLLRSPFVGMSDAGLWWLSNAPPTRPDSNSSLAQTILSSASLSEQLFTGLSGEDTLALKRAAKLLTRFAEWRGRRTAVEILDWALSETGFLSVQALQPRGEIAVAAVRKLIELARGFEARGNRHLSDFVRWLRERADAEWGDPGGSHGPDLTADLPADEDAVQIGTIHSAKGLEFPIVILADAGAGIPPNNAWALFTPEHGLGLRLGSTFDGLKAAADAVHEQNVAKAKQEDDAERLRLLYVALTRARDYLIVIGESGRGANWRKLLDEFWAASPEALTRVDAKNDELRKAAPGHAIGLLEFEAAEAHVRAGFETTEVIALPAIALEAPHAVKTNLSAVRDVRVSVSQLALWLWCPRRAAFAAWENEDGMGARTSAQAETPTQDAEDAQSGIAEAAREAETAAGPDARALGTAVHGALETLFGADDPLSPDTEKSAAERFARELTRENVPAAPNVKEVYDRALALARSAWGKRILALPSEDRNVETPFQWRINGVTMIGQLDLLAKTAPDRWQVIDYKLASLEEKAPESESVTRYAWQAGLYARVAATILAADPKHVEAALVFLRDDPVAPSSVEKLGHGRISDETLERVTTQYAEASSCAEPLELPAQLWIPADTAPKARDAALCKKHKCPYVARCFKQAP